jgi:signal transduction histidine kinase
MFTTERPGSIELTHLMRMRDALVHLAKGGVDIVLLDMGLPDGHGLDTVRRARAVAPDVPLIVLTGLDDEALAAEAMKEGAQDYLIKGQIENRALPRALRHAIERHRMQAETDHIRTNQLQFKDEFLSHVSHELRSPLTAIYQFVTILQDGLAGEVNQEQHLEIVLRNVKQLRAMINDLLEVTSVQAGKLLIRLEPASISDAIAYTVDTLQGAARDKGITLTAETGGLLPDLWADPTRVRQMLIILVDNAIKFTPTNGAVKVWARRWESDPRILVIEVADSGCGISAAETELIFERLFQVADPAMAARTGLGLGLYICKELVNNYDIFFAVDGFSSLTEARKHEPDLILLDLGLPAGDGFLVMDRIKAVPALAMIPIIVVSGRSGAANRERALKAGAKAFLEKPVDNAELLAVIGQGLGETVKRERPLVHDLGTL